MLSGREKNNPRNRRCGSKCEELKLRKANLRYPNDQTLFGSCEKFRRRARTGPSLKRHVARALDQLSGHDFVDLGARQPDCALRAEGYRRFIAS